MFKTHILGTPIIVSTDPDVNKVILHNHGNTFIPAYPKSITELFGKNSILQINGNLHKRVHALIAGFLRSPQHKARITKDIENSVKNSLATWKDMHQIYVQDETKKVSLPLNTIIYNYKQLSFFFPLSHEVFGFWVSQITFEVLVKALLSVGPGEDLNFLKREFEEFIKGLICLPIKLPGTRLYKSLKVINLTKLFYIMSGFVRVYFSWCCM